MNTSSALQTLQHDWSDFVHTQPSLPLELRADFFGSAPQGTLVEVDGDLYQRSPLGLWLALGETVVEANFGSPYSTHESYETRFLAGLANSPAVDVRVLRLGDYATSPEHETQRVANHLNAVNRRRAEERAAERSI